MIYKNEKILLDNLNYMGFSIGNMQFLNYTAYTLSLSPNSKPLNEFPNAVIINELEHQAAILTLKLVNSVQRTVLEDL